MAPIRSLATALLLLFAGPLPAQQPATEDVAELKREAAELRAMLEKLEKKIDRLETVAPPVAIKQPVQVQAEVQTPPPAVTQTGKAPVQSESNTGPLGGATLNLLLDTYYEYNFNSPIGRVNLLRAYDVSSNSFSLNQAALVFEDAAVPDEGKRWGVRLDLQWGQATQTLQGNGVNESRPDIYRNLFQAYGTYVFPVGRGLTVDFGKWSSSLGIEGNYTKDQINYSRSFWFDYLPFYHTGARATYNLTDAFAVHYWITNGTEQTEANNGFKDQSAGFAWQPRKSVNWTANYYLGQEHPDAIFYPNGAPAGLTNLPEQQGVPFQSIVAPPTGKLHIIDSYVAWDATPRLSFAAEGDWVLERNYTNSAPGRVDGGAAYARYQVSPKFAIGGRAEYLADHGGLYTGISQELKEITLTTEYKLTDNLLIRWEWRRDMSNHQFFYTDTQGILKNEQTTAGAGVVWWFGAKKGGW